MQSMGKIKDESLDPESESELEISELESELERGWFKNKCGVCNTVKTRTDGAAELDWKTE